MKKYLYAFKDSVLGQFGDLICQNVPEDVYLELVKASCVAPEIPFQFWQSDLYLLGTFDTKTGVFEPEEAPKFLESMSTFKYLNAAYGQKKEGEAHA